MAKKKKAKVAAETPREKLRPGHMRCKDPECNAVIAGCNRKACPKCGFQFKANTNKAKGKKAEAQARRQARVHLTEALALAELLGENAEDILAKIDGLGGVANAREWFKYIAEIKAQG